MKRTLLLLLSTLTLICFVSAGLFACSKESSTKTITGVTFTNAEYVYDGTEKILTISGDLPQGVSVSYTNNKATNAGDYAATAKLTGKNYTPLTLSATLKIKKADITGVTVASEQSIKHDGEFHYPEILGVIPQGVTVKYFVENHEYSQGFKAVGTYAVTIKLFGDNYNSLELNTTFKVNFNLLGLAQTVISSFGSIPNPWEFLPESFATENREIDSIPTYENFTSVASIPKNGIGKQLSVVYGILNKTEVALSYVDDIYAVMNTIKNLYSNFLDNSPEEYKAFTSNVGPIVFSLLIGETEYTLSASVGTVQIKLFADTNESYYGARIQLTESNVLKYEVNDSSMKIAWSILNSHSTQIEFARDDDGNVLGYIYEYLITGDKTLIAASTLVEITEDFTILIGTKGDKIPTAEFRNCEVYSNTTGNLVGTEVKEEVEIKGLTALYNTLWFTIDDIAGINYIKKVDEVSGTNPDTIYLNNKTEKLHTDLYGGISSKMFSRKFDIEFKTMSFFVFDQQKGEYEETTCEIPMLFVQEECLSDLENKFEKTNDVSITLLVTQKERNAISFGYNDLLEIYETIKSKVSFEEISNYCKI